MHRRMAVLLVAVICLAGCVTCPRWPACGKPVHGRVMFFRAEPAHFYLGSEVLDYENQTPKMKAELTKAAGTETLFRGRVFNGTLVSLVPVK